MDRSKIADPSSRNRSKITNGSWKLIGVDNRKPVGRRYRDLCVSLAAEFGGEAALNEPKRALIRQAAGIMIETEKMQAAIVLGQPVDAEQLVRLSNALARMMAVVGVKPASKPPKGRSLQSYLEARTK